MKKVLLSCAFSLISTVVYAQPTVGPNSRFRVDHPNSDVISRLELQIDGGAWNSIGLTSVVDPLTPANHTTYEAPIPNLSVGLHTASVRACNALGCGPNTPNLSFRVIALPGVPTLRLTQTIAVAGIIQRGPYNLGNISVIDVRIPEYNVTLNFGSPTWNIPGVYSASVNDKVFLSLSK